MELFDLYSHQESAITNRTNLMLVAQSFLVVGYVEAISNFALQLALAILGFLVTTLSLYVGGRELKFFYLLRDKLKEQESIFEEIDAKLSITPSLNFLGRASKVLCYHLQIIFLLFWIFCFFYSFVNKSHL